MRCVAPRKILIMPCCAIISCRKRSEESSVTQGGISFHRFPKEPNTKEQWVRATGREDWVPTKRSTICSRHFKEDDFLIKNSDRRFLKPGARPHQKILILESLTSSTCLIQSPQKRHIDKAVCSTDETIKRLKLQLDVNSSAETSDHIHQPINPIITTRQNVKPTVNIRSDVLITSTSDSNASTPRKKKLKQIISTKNYVIKRQQVQIKRIQAQNRRLKKKIIKIEDMFLDIQDKFYLRNEDISTLKNVNLQA